jgi:hypothetical protein
VSSSDALQYDTLEEAAAATARVYVNAVQQLVQQHQLHVWLHSVPPVLSETRVVVQLFNSAVERECAQHAATSSAAAGGGLGRLQFVDLDDALQQDARCLQFDGTHLHPCYVEHLQAALQCNPSM